MKHVSSTQKCFQSAKPNSVNHLLFFSSSLYSKGFASFSGSSLVSSFCLLIWQMIYIWNVEFWVSNSNILIPWQSLVIYSTKQGRLLCKKPHHNSHAQTEAVTCKCKLYNPLDFFFFLFFLPSQSCEFQLGFRRLLYFPLIEGGKLGETPLSPLSIPGQYLGIVVFFSRSECILGFRTLLQNSNQHHSHFLNTSNQ